MVDFSTVTEKICLGEMSYLSKRKKGSRRNVSTVPMAPMIDMVFLLLVFFMCVSSLSQAGNRIEVELPESKAAQVPDDLSGRITIAVKAGGEYHLNAYEVSEAELGRKLLELADGSPALKLRIRADAHAEFTDIKNVMRIAAESGISDIIYAAHQMD